MKRWLGLLKHVDRPTGATREYRDFLKGGVLEGKTGVERKNPLLSVQLIWCSQLLSLHTAHSLETDLTSRLAQLTTLSPRVGGVDSSRGILRARDAKIEHQFRCPDGAKVSTFLPARFSSELSDTDLEELSQGMYFLRCTGQTGRSPNTLPHWWVRKTWVNNKNPRGGLHSHISGDCVCGGDSIIMYSCEYRVLALSVGVMAACAALVVGCAPLVLLLVGLLVVTTPLVVSDDDEPPPRKGSPITPVPVDETEPEDDGGDVDDDEYPDPWAFPPRADRIYVILEPVPPGPFEVIEGGRRRQSVPQPRVRVITNDRSSTPRGIPAVPITPVPRPSTSRTTSQHNTSDSAYTSVRCRSCFSRGVSCPSCRKASGRNAPEEPKPSPPPRRVQCPVCLDRLPTILPLSNLSESNLREDSPDPTSKTAKPLMLIQYKITLRLDEAPRTSDLRGSLATLGTRFRSSPPGCAMVGGDVRGWAYPPSCIFAIRRRHAVPPWCGVGDDVSGRGLAAILDHMSSSRPIRTRAYTPGISTRVAEATNADGAVKSDTQDRECLPDWLRTGRPRGGRDHPTDLLAFTGKHVYEETL
ncbi:hypothetical protein J6590_086065 [Homalodisca vitripennis]|nr:hypothetical protein J6590_086065 [Homalodisca vitripennis]